MMELRPYQKEAVEAIFNEWEKGIKRILLVLPTGCHDKNQGILMFDGSIKKSSEIEVGDKLMGDDGTPRNVLHLSRGVSQMYKVIPVKGKAFTVTGNHILPLVRTNEKRNPKFPCQKKGGEIDFITVEDYMKSSKWFKHIHKLIRSKEIQSFDYDSHVSIDPYFLGLVLGDGGLKYQISITTADKECVDEIVKQSKIYGFTFRTEPAGKAKTYFLKLGKNKLLKKQLEELGILGKGSYDKFVPEAYKFGDLETRKQILAGLLDTDGSLNCNVFDFISASKRLAEDVTFIARSLGLSAFCTPTVKTCQNNFQGTFWRVSISGDTFKIPNRIPHKTANERKQKKNALRTGIKEIIPVGKDNYYGFTVDGNNLYLMDDFTITHNCGKTICFAKVAEECVSQGKRVLILAHRGELLEQAADKIKKVTGLNCSVEKAEQTAIGSWMRITVGSVQTLQNEKRLKKYKQDAFDTIIVDEAHHILSASYQKVMDYFCDANVLGVTATPDRGDMKNLGQFFESLAYEYTLPKAIKNKYLSPIRAQTIPLDIDFSDVSVQAGDFKASDIGHALDPYLHVIAKEMETYCKGRKTVVFLPLVATSQDFKNILNENGFRAAEVNGNSEDRKQVLSDFDKGKYNVICNSMLLTEGWDCPSVDCIIVLRPTKIRSLYAQMVGRGTRLCEGKDYLLLLDFLWHTDRHELCHPASLICESKEVADKMTKNLEESNEAIDLEDAENEAIKDVQEEREQALMEQLKAMRKRKRKLVDPVQFEMSIEGVDMTDYQPTFGWEMEPPSQKQLSTLEKYGIYPDEIENAGKASLILNRLSKRREEGLSTPKQIRLLERYGFKHVGTWSFVEARNMISRIAGHGWNTYGWIEPSEYVPGKE